MQTKDEKIREKVAILKELRNVIIDEKRLFTDAEQENVTALMLEIKALEDTHGTPKRDAADLPDPSYWHDKENRIKRESSAGYELRTADQTKSWSDLYGKGRSDYRWEDPESTFFEAVISQRYHPGLVKRALVSGTPSAGGFLVPSETAKAIHDVSLESEIVMPRANVMPMASDTLHLPAFSIGDHSSNLYGGFIAYYKGEGSTLTEADPTVRECQLSLNKLTGFLKYSNELRADMRGGEKALINIAGKGLAWYRDLAYLKGSGVGKPLGILNSPSLITVSKETGQAADTVTYSNLTEMLAVLAPSSFSKAVWVCHISTIPQLLQLSIAVGTGGSFIPVMSETSGKFTILSRPVIFTEKTEPLGTKGDIMLCDFSQYVIGLREEMRVDTSQHVYFTTDHSALRIIERHDGQSIWNEALTLEDGSTEVSPFVTLEAR